MIDPARNNPWAFSLGAKVLYGCPGNMLATVRTRFRNTKGENVYVLETQFQDEYIVRPETALEAFYEFAELGSTPKCKGFFPPTSGFLREHWYIAHVAYGMSNPVHEVLLYAGLCDNGDLKPGNYSHLAGLHYRLEEEEARINRPVYLRVVKDLGTLGTERYFK